MQSLWLGRASGLRLNGREFDPRSVDTGMGDRLQAGIPPRYVTSHLGQLSLLPCGKEMSTSQIAVMRCGWGLKAGWLIPFVDKRVGGR